MKKYEFCSWTEEDIIECLECCGFDYVLEKETQKRYYEYREDYYEYLELFYED